MGIFRKREAPPEPPYSPTNNVSDVLLSALIKGESITCEKALTLPAVSGAVDLVGNMIASMPVRLFEKTDGEVREVHDDRRVWKLNGDTGDTLNGFEMKKAMVTDYLLNGSGYVYVDRFRNEVRGLHYVENIYVTVLKNFRPIFKYYEILVEGEKYKPYDFVKLLRNTKDGSEGVGLIKEVSKALETAYNTLVYQLGLVSTGGNKKGFIKSENHLDKDAIDALKSAWTRLYSNNKENVVILNDGLDFKEASNNSVEMQLNESKKTLQDEINTIFHIYPNDFWRTFKEAIFPVVKAFEASLNRDLLLEEEKGRFFFEFDVKEITKANITERYNAYKTAKETGFLTLNEIRQAENLNRVEGMNVVNVGLGAVLYDVDTHTYYTPNTDSVTSPTDGVDTVGDTGETEKIQNLIIDKELDTAFEESGNSSEG